MAALLLHNTGHLLSILEDGSLRPRRFLSKEYAADAYDRRSEKYVYFSAVVGGLPCINGFLFDRRALSGPFFLRSGWGGGDLSGARGFAAKERGRAIRKARRYARLRYARAVREIPAEVRRQFLAAAPKEEPQNAPRPKAGMFRAAFKYIESTRAYLEWVSHEIFTAHVVPLKPHLKVVVVKMDMDQAYKDKVERIVRERYPGVRVIYLKTKEQRVVYVK